ncbi:MULTISPECIES: sigma-70 family RNA polymerase sigma factor [unclassified Micromonospora]|uniref:sigma-70 family RNA polymerase sigma factor n=1 Tax=unclassified Micromonospora TaxID=2617518 RepID=UPI0036377E89
MAEDAQVTAWALAAARGDREAATEFVRATRASVWRYLLPSFAGRSSARTWLLVIARRVAAGRARTGTPPPRTVSMPDMREVSNRRRSGSDQRITLDRLIAALPADRREAFVATQLLGMSYAETAELCGCPVSAVRSRVARAREDLVAALRARPGRGDAVG